MAQNREAKGSYVGACSVLLLVLLQLFSHDLLHGVLGNELRHDCCVDGLVWNVKQIV